VSPMENLMNFRIPRLILGFAVAAMPVLSAGCGASLGTVPGSTTLAAQNGTVNMMVSDASTEDWATIGVKILSISLTPQGGGTPINIYTAPTPAPIVNLVELDQLGEILGNLTVPAGTYTSTTLTIAANPGDVLLTAAADPEAGFAATPGATVPSGLVQIQGATGAAGNLTVPVSVNFISPLVVTASQSTALDLEFNLSHPAFIVGHVPITAGTTVWAVNFKGPVRHHLIPDITRLVLRHLYGSVTSVATDNSSITITKQFSVVPATSPETPVASSQSLQILADSANGTIFYDVDAKTSLTVKNFSGEATSLPGKFVRVAARYQQDGTLVAARIWASSSFNSLWMSPEGHVLHVNTATNIVTVQNEGGNGVPLTINSNTQFFYRTPANALSDTIPIATGTAFLAAHNLVRGFKVHASVVDPLAAPLVAQTIDIEIARYDGTISAAGPTTFVYTRKFNTAADNYAVTLSFISNNTANGKDANGNAILGFKWWNFAFPTILNNGATSGISAIANFDSATNGGVSFGGSPAITLSALGESPATWADPANSSGWSVPSVVLDPTPVPLGTVAAGYVNGAFTLTVPGGANAVTANLNTTSGSATLVYQVDRTGTIVTISPVDITTAGGVLTITTNLIAGAPVKVFGVPQSDGTMKAYVLVYYTGIKSSI
jgi:hypothetical protein